MQRHSTEIFYDPESKSDSGAKRTFGWMIFAQTYYHVYDTTETQKKWITSDCCIWNINYVNIEILQIIFFTIGIQILFTNFWIRLWFRSAEKLAACFLYIVLQPCCQSVIWMRINHSTISGFSIFVIRVETYKTGNTADHSHAFHIFRDWDPSHFYTRLFQIFRFHFHSSSIHFQSKMYSNALSSVPDSPVQNHPDIAIQSPFMRPFSDRFQVHWGQWPFTSINLHIAVFPRWLVFGCVSALVEICTIVGSCFRVMQREQLLFPYFALCNMNLSMNVEFSRLSDNKIVQELHRLFYTDRHV